MPGGRVVTATVLFTDVVESTRQRIALGDDVADEVSLAHDRRLRDAMTRHRGRVVKALGDGLMVIFDSATDAIAAGVAVQQLTERDNRSTDPSKRVLLRVGISAGDVQNVDDDFHGTPVVEAKRLEAAAQPGQILVSEKVRSLAGSRGGHGYASVGALDLKGLPEPILAYAVAWDPDVEPAPAPASAPKARPESEPRTRVSAGRWAALTSAVVVLAIIGVTIAVVVGHDDKTNTGATPPTTAALNYRPRFVSTSCPQSSGASHCGALIVPENRTKVDGRTIRLAVAITSAAATQTSASGSGAVVPSVWLSSASPVGPTAGGEEVALAQRGWDGSTPDLECPGVADAYFKGVEAEHPVGVPPAILRTAMFGAARACRDRYRRAGIDLSAYTREAAADDVRDLAVAMGWKQINVEGSGNWSATAVLVARRYPSLVRSVVIEDPLSSDQSDFSGLVANVGTAWQKYIGECAAAAACRSRFGDLTAGFQRIFANLNAHPARVPVAVPGGPNVNLRVDGDIAANTAYLALKSPPALPLIASVVSSGDPGIIGGFLAGFLWSSRAFPWGAYINDICANSLARLDRVQLAAGVTAFPQFRSVALDPRLDICSVWKVAGAPTFVPTRISASAPLSAPALIVEGQRIPDSSPDWARAAGRQFAQAAVVVVPTMTADPLSSGIPCLAQLRAQFLAQPTATLDPASCLRKIPPIAFAGA